MDCAIYFSLSAADPAAGWFQRIHDAGWYGHLRFKETPLILVVFVAWLIAFIEDCLAVRLIDTAALSTQQRNSRQCRR